MSPFALSAMHASFGRCAVRPACAGWAQAHAVLSACSTIAARHVAPGRLDRCRGTRACRSPRAAAAPSSVRQQIDARVVEPDEPRRAHRQRGRRVVELDRLRARRPGARWRGTRPARGRRATAASTRSPTTKARTSRAPPSTKRLQVERAARAEQLFQALLVAAIQAARRRCPSEPYSGLTTASPSASSARARLATPLHHTPARRRQPGAREQPARLELVDGRRAARRRR